MLLRGAIDLFIWLMHVRQCLLGWTRFIFSGWLKETLDTRKKGGSPMFSRPPEVDFGPTVLRKLKINFLDKLNFRFSEKARTMTCVSAGKLNVILCAECTELSQRPKERSAICDPSQPNKPEQTSWHFVHKLSTILVSVSLSGNVCQIFNQLLLSYTLIWNPSNHCSRYKAKSHVEEDLGVSVFWAV